MTDVEDPIAKEHDKRIHTSSRDSCCAKHAIWILDIAFLLAYGGLYYALDRIRLDSPDWKDYGRITLVITVFLVAQFGMAVANLIVTICLWPGIAKWYRILGFLPTIVLAITLLVGIIQEKIEREEDESSNVDCLFGACE